MVVSSISVFLFVVVLILNFPCMIDRQLKKL